MNNRQDEMTRQSRSNLNALVLYQDLSETSNGEKPGDGPQCCLQMMSSQEVGNRRHSGNRRNNDSHNKGAPSKRLMQGTEMSDLWHWWNLIDWKFFKFRWRNSMSHLHFRGSRSTVWDVKDYMSHRRIHESSSITLDNNDYTSHPRLKCHLGW